MSSFNWWVTASVAGPAVVSSIVHDHTFDQDSSLIHRNHPCKSKPVVTQFAAKTYRRLKAMLSGKRSDLDCRIIQCWKTHGPICRGHRDPRNSHSRREGLGRQWLWCRGLDFYFHLLTCVDLDVLLIELWLDGIHKEAKERFAYLHATFERDDCWMTAGSVTSTTLKVEPICASKVALFAPLGPMIFPMASLGMFISMTTSVDSILLSWADLGILSWNMSDGSRLSISSLPRTILRGAPISNHSKALPSLDVDVPIDAKRLKD